MERPLRGDLIECKILNGVANARARYSFTGQLRREDRLAARTEMNSACLAAKACLHVGCRCVGLVRSRGRNATKQVKAHQEGRREFYWVPFWERLKLML